MGSQFPRPIGRILAISSTAAAALTSQPLSAQSGRASSPSYLHDVWTAENGLPVNSATAIVQDSEGFLWIGTWQGLVRFDGSEFKVFNATETDGLDSNRITALILDKEGALWIGTTNGGLTRLKDGRFASFTSESGPGGDYIHDLYFGPKGEILVQFSAGRIREVVEREEAVRFEEVASIGTRRARVVRFDVGPPAVTWVGTSYGLVRLVEGTTDTLTTEDGLIADDIMSLELMENGTLWAGTQNGVTRVSPQGLTTFPMPGAIVGDIHVSPDGRVWLSAGGIGLMALENDRFVRIEFGQDPIGSNLEALFTDSHGSLWAGTTGTGLHRLRTQLFASFGRANGVDGSQFLGIAADRSGQVWFGSSRDGVFRLRDGVVRRFGAAAGLPDQRAWTVYSSMSGTLWAGTHGGAAYFDGSTFVSDPRVSSRSVRAILERSNGDLLLLGYGGIQVVGADQTITDIPGADQFLDNATAGLESSTGVVWIGTEASGLCRLEEQFSCLAISDSPSHRAIRALFEPAPGRLWLGTYGGGLCEWDERVLRCLDESAGLPDGTVHSIAEDDLGYVWLSSNAGVFRYKRSILERYFSGDTTGIYPDHFDKWHGLPSSETNGGFQPAVARTADGLLWYPTASGVVSIDPRKVPDRDPVAPRVHDVRVDGVAFTSGVPFPPGADRLVFRYSAPTLQDPRHTRFRYRLDRHDDHWVDGGSDRSAVYTNLEPGDYSLRLQASEGSDPWVESTYPFELESFFYETTWFLVVLALAGGLVAGFSFNLRVRGLKRRQVELEVRVEERTARLTELDRAKNRFFTGISHEFRTPLQLILGPLEDGTDWGDTDQAARYRSLMRSNARRMLDLVNQLLELAKIESGHLALNPVPGDLVVFTSDLVRGFIPLAERTEVRLRFTTTVADYHCRFDAGRLGMAVGNVLSNALKFTPRGGSVVVGVEELPGGGIEITVADTGPGVAPGDTERIFDLFERGMGEASHRTDGAGIGLALAREIASLHGGAIILESEPGQGATFRLRFPLARDAEAEPQHETAVVDAGEETVPGEPEPREKPVILLVDDNSDVRDLLRDFLEPAYEILEAGDGLTALHVAQDAHPDLIVSDVMMPRMDGFEFVKAVRSQQDLRTIPLILLTARASEESAIEGIDLGADNYLQKPVSAAELRSRIARLLEARRVMMERYLREIRVEPAGVIVEDSEERLLRAVVSTIEANLHSEDFTVENLADMLGVSPRQLRRRLAATISESPARLIQRMRMERAAQLIEAGAGNVAEVAGAVGFSDSSYFATAFRRHFGHAPSSHPTTPNQAD